MPKFGLILNSSWSKGKSRGQALMKFANEISTESLLNKESNETEELYLRLGRNPCLKINKNPRRNLGKMKNLWFLKL